MRSSACIWTAIQCSTWSARGGEDEEVDVLTPEEIRRLLDAQEEPLRTLLLTPLQSLDGPGAPSTYLRPLRSLFAPSRPPTDARALSSQCARYTTLDADNFPSPSISTGAPACQSPPRAISRPAPDLHELADRPGRFSRVPRTSPGVSLR